NGGYWRRGGLPDLLLPRRGHKRVAEGLVRDYAALRGGGGRGPRANGRSRTPSPDTPGGYRRSTTRRRSWPTASVTTSSLPSFMGASAATKLCPTATSTRS